MLDSYGNLIMSENISKNDYFYDASRLSCGLYFMKIEDVETKSIETYKIVKE